jgi:hypothetical protein
MVTTPGRKSSDALAAPSFGPERLRPPPDLDPKARAIFVDIIAAARPEHFQPVDSALLCAYCRAVAIERECAVRIMTDPVAAPELLETYKAATTVMRIGNAPAHRAAVASGAYQSKDGARWRGDVLLRPATIGGPPMTRRDKDALQRALDMVRALDPIVVAAVDRMLKSETWEEASKYAVYHLQMKSLRLRPWMCPPCDSDDVVDPAGMCGGKPEEVALRQRMIALGLSPYEPDPLAAIERAEAEAEAPLPAA